MHIWTRDTWYSITYTYLITLTDILQLQIYKYLIFSLQFHLIVRYKNNFHYLVDYLGIKCLYLYLMKLRYEMLCAVE